MQLPTQQSELLVQSPPMGTQLWPVVTQLPFWHWPPVQQSASLVQGGSLTQTLFTQVVPAPQLIVEQSCPASGRQAPSQAKPVGEPGLGTQMPEQHSSGTVHGWMPPPEVSRHMPLAKQRDTPDDVGQQFLFGPTAAQQFCDAPWPPHTSPSARQDVIFWQRLTPLESAAQAPGCKVPLTKSLQQSMSLVHGSPCTRQPPMAVQ